MKLLKVVFPLIVAFSTHNVRADHTYDLSKKFGIGGAAALHFVAGPRDFITGVDTGHSLAAWGRYHFNSCLAAELAYDRSEFRNNPTAADMLTINALWRVLGAARLSPMVRLGAGPAIVYNRGISDTKSTRAHVRLGAGLEYLLTPAWSFGAMVNYDYTAQRSTGRPEVHTVSLTASMTYYFGTSSAATTHEPVVMKQVASVSTDGDSDHDGVMNFQDKCPATPSGSAVNEYGCQEGEKVAIKLEVQFLSGKSDVRGQYMNEIQSVAQFLKNHENTNAEVEGHTDNAGSATANVVLSQARSAAVRDIMVNQYGVDASRVTAHGYGASKPVNDNATAKGRAANRRVVVGITGTK